MNLLNLPDSFKAGLVRCGVDRSGRILLAVSGGIDSMVLLHLAKTAELKIAVAHVNYGLRGAASDADEALVRKVCEELAIPLHAAHLAIETDGSVQNEAREKRYAWFNKLLAEENYAGLLTAHHRDDRLETFFMNFLRGSGIPGLKSIPYRNGSIARPLLDIPRLAIEAYAEEHHLLWREDESNAGDAYLRNQIRHHALPLFESLVPTSADRMEQSINHIAEANAYFERKATEFLARHTGQTGTPMFISDTEWASLFQDAPLHFYVLSELGFSSGQIEALAAMPALQVGKTISGNEGTAIRERTGISFAEHDRNLLQRIELTGDKGSMKYGAQTIEWERLASDAERKWPKARTVQYFDDAKLIFPLQIRPWEGGDRLWPEGMDGSKKVSDILTDAKVPAFRKRDIGVLESDGKVVWLLGYRADRRFTAGADSKEVFGIRIVEPDQPQNLNAVF